MPHQIQGSQTDFSFGEIDVSLKRNEQHPARKAGLRQMANARILNSTAIQDRPGRSALFPITNSGTRTEEFTIAAGSNFKICFGPGSIQIINSAGTVVQAFADQGNGAALPWASASDIQLIVYAIFNLTITITFGFAMRPQVITYDGVSAWSIADYAEAITPSGQKRTPFYRISPQNVTMLPSAVSGNITIKFSSPIVVAGMVGTRARFCGRQILYGAVINSSSINATVIEPLPPGQSFSLSGVSGDFAVGDVVDGAISGAQGIVTSSPSTQTLNLTSFVSWAIGSTVTGVTSGAIGIITASLFSGLELVLSLTSGTFLAGETVDGPSSGTAVVNTASAPTLIVQVVQTPTNIATFVGAEAIAGPSGSATIVTATTVVPGAVSVWDDEVMNSYRGFPASCFVDQFRLGFCNFPAIPGGIGWSAINSQFDQYANDASSPDNAIFEIAPDKVQVFFVVPGMESSEFVFCDRKLYYIAINPTNPLKSGSVSFQILSSDGCAQVQPRPSQETILYANAGKNSMMAVTAPGNYYRPFDTTNLSEFSTHLFSGITAIAVPIADSTFSERYAYVLNAAGAITVGKYTLENGQFKGAIGWGPWSGGGTVSWVSAWNSDVLFTTSYFGTPICEVLDDTQYLDCALSVNNLPAAFAPPGGKGPLWFIRSQTVDLIDQVTRFMGVYWIDPNGNIIPQFQGGENLGIASLVAGQPWTMTVEPFAPDAPSGTDMKQRMNLRQISNLAIYVVNSTGFTFASLFSSKQTATSPALGTITQTRVVPAWNMGDNATLPPTLRETVETYPPPGSSYDPRAAIIKDNPGPLQILEIAMEVSI